MKKRFLIIIFILTTLICLVFGIVGCTTEKDKGQPALCDSTIYFKARNTGINIDIEGVIFHYLCADVVNISDYKIQARLRCDYTAEPIYSNFVELEPNTAMAYTLSIAIPSGWYNNADVLNKTTVEAAIIGNDKEHTDSDPALVYDYGYENAPTSSQNVKKGEHINLIVPNRAGYEFLGWYNNGSKVESGVWKYDSAITLTARWKEIQYNITYNTDNGILPDNCLKSYTVSSCLPYTLPIPTKLGANFAGWYENADFSGEPIIVIQENSLQNYVLYAKYTDEQPLEFELSFDDTYYIIIGYKGNPQYITVPETIDGLPIKEIAVKAFEGCNTLIEISLPDSIHKIGSSAFYNCRRLTSVTIPDSVNKIGDWAFRDCSSLTSITIPDNVTTIGDWVFRGCSSLTSVIIGKGVTSISNYTFEGCSSLTSVTIPDSVTSIGSSAFYRCSSLTSVTIPASVTSIGESAFYRCSSLISITIPNRVTSIGNSTFEDCSSLESIAIPDSVTSIGGSAFPEKLCIRYSGCYYLPTKDSEYGFLYEVISKDITNVKIHTDCKTINSSAFRYCSKLESITIPDGITSIGDFVFSSCSSLTSISIPDSVTNIGNNAFNFCRSLTSITIPDSVITIGGRAFSFCESLTSVIIGKGVTNIGNYAFEDCSSLTSITIPDGVTSIGDYVFYNCSSLASVTIPDSVTNIGNNAFLNSSKLNVFFKGAKDDWNDKEIADDTINYSATLYYFKESEPTDDGNYWHYDVDGKTPVIWEKEN